MRRTLGRGIVIPASPLALNARRRLDERRQRGLWRYYFAAGAGGIALGVHTTQFAIRNTEIGLFAPLLELGREEMDRADRGRKEPLVRIAGVCGRTHQAVSEAERAKGLGYHVGLLSLAAMERTDDEELIGHCQRVAEVIPLMGFYLQPAVGGRVLSYSFWRRLMDIPRVIGIKIAPFNRYQTLEVMRAVADSGRHDVALYTGNDDHIVGDLVTPFGFACAAGPVTLRMVGGLLGHWAVWTHKAAQLLRMCHDAVGQNIVGVELLRMGAEVTDANAAFFDAAHGFAGCIAGLHEVLRRQGLLEGTWCLDEREGLSPGQMEEIDRVHAAYPHLNDDAFVREHRDEWIRGE